jgi:hypothetical protein
MGMLSKLNVLHYLFSLNKRGRFVAHCLNFDIVATADSMNEAERRLEALVRFHIESYLRTNGAACLSGPAPKEFFSSYTESLRRGGAQPSSTLRISVPQTVPMPVPYGELEVVAAKAA